MIFLRRETFKGYLKSYPGIVGIVILCLLYFIFELFGGYLKNSLTLYQAGALLSIPVEDPIALHQPWRYITSMFMHADFYHIFHNMFMLIIFAPPLERLIQTKRFIPFYLLCGIGGSLIAVLISSAKGIPMIHLGASGAVYGVLGAYLFMALFRKRMLDEQSKKTIYMILAIGIISSIIVPNISLWGHIGGLVTGLLLYRLFDRRQFKA